MAAGIFDSPLFSRLFPTGDAGRLFSDTAAVRAMLLVEGTLAKVQAQHGIIPEISGAAIHRASLEIQLDPGALADAAGQNGVPVPGLVAAFRSEMNAPEHAQYVHYGATSQDIMDTALMLRLRQTLALAEADLRDLLRLMADEARTHAETTMCARTYGQAATPTTWGAVLATWGMPLADALDDLARLRSQSLWVSLSGASGTSSELGGDPAALRRALAEALGLQDPGRSWHTDRGPLLRIAAWMASVSATLGTMGRSLTGLSASGIGEVALAGAGSSSTMPQKQNPVGPSVLEALALQMSGAQATLQAAATHQYQRDGASWFAEWATMPQIALTCASGLHTACHLMRNLAPVPDRMLAGLNASHGAVFAEALSFALADHMPRPQAQAITKDLIAGSAAAGMTLEEIARAEWPDLPEDLFDPLVRAGDAAAGARAFADRVGAL